jgi:hypothetical protein
VINAFTGSMTYEALVHALRRETPHTMQELLEITTKCAMGEEAAHANFSDKAKAARPP